MGKISYDSTKLLTRTTKRHRRTAPPEVVVIVVMQVVVIVVALVVIVVVAIVVVVVVVIVKDKQERVIRLNMTRQMNKRRFGPWPSSGYRYKLPQHNLSLNLELT